jgi:hypothetical protein
MFVVFTLTSETAAVENDTVCSAAELTGVAGCFPVGIGTALFCGGNFYCNFDGIEVN